MSWQVSHYDTTRHPWCRTQATPHLFLAELVILILVDGFEDINLGRGVAHLDQLHVKQQGCVWQQNNTSITILQVSDNLLITILQVSDHSLITILQVSNNSVSTDLNKQQYFISKWD